MVDNNRSNYTNRDNTRASLARTSSKIIGRSPTLFAQNCRKMHNELVQEMRYRYF